MKKITITKFSDSSTMRYSNTGLSDITCEGSEEMDASDGYHTFTELYDHRIELYIALCLLVGREETIGEEEKVWRSKLHSDGTMFEGCFVLGIGKKRGQQLTYHLPLVKWNEVGFAETLEKAPEWDGHTPADVLNRLKSL